MPSRNVLWETLGLLEFCEQDETHLTISLWRGPKPVPPREGGATVVFSVDDAYKAVKELRKRGVKCDDVEAIPNVVTFASFYDPEGNRLQVAGPPPKT